MVVLDAGSADEWQDVVSHCFIPLSCMSFESGFHGRMEHLALDSRISISTVSTDGTTVERTEKLAHQADSDDVHLSMQISSRGSVRQGRNVVAVRQGSVTMYATDAPYYQDYSEPGQQQLIVQVSRGALEVERTALAAGLDRLSLSPNDASRTFFSYVASLQKDARRLVETIAPDPAAVATDLASTMIRASGTGGRVVPRTRGGLMYSVQDFVAMNLARVRVDDIAAEFFVSRRTLYNLFDLAGTTPSEYLRRRRLDLAAARLLDPSHSKMSIGEIASGAGFDDATTFARAFRREYGLSPREWRSHPVPALAVESVA